MSNEIWKFKNINSGRLQRFAAEYFQTCPTPDKATKTLADIDVWMSKFKKPDDDHNPRFILEKNNGQSTFFNIGFHMPFLSSFDSPQEFRTEKALEFFRLLCAFCKSAREQEPDAPTGKYSISWPEYAGLLTAHNDHSFTPLHNAVKFGKKPLYDALLKEENSLRGEKLATGEPVLSDADYARQFILPAKGDLTVIRSAVNSGNVEIYRAVTGELDKLLEQGVISNADYAKQFMLCQDSNFAALLHGAIVSDSHAMFQDIEKRLKDLYQKQIITRDELRDQILHGLEEGFSLLQCASRNPDPKCYADVMETLKSFRKAGVIDDHDIARQLTNIGSDGLTLMHNAAITRKEELYRQIKADLLDMQLRTDEKGRPYISDEDMAEQFGRLSNRRYSILNDAVISGNEALFVHVAKDLKTYVPQDALRNILMESGNEQRNTIYHHATHPDSNRRSIVLGLHQLFFHAFGEEAGHQKIAELYATRNALQLTPRYDRQPGWLKDALNQGFPGTSGRAIA